MGGRGISSFAFMPYKGKIKILLVASGGSPPHLPEKSKKKVGSKPTMQDLQLLPGLYKNLRSDFKGKLGSLKDDLFSYKSFKILGISSMTWG